MNSLINELWKAIKPNCELVDLYVLHDLLMDDNDIDGIKLIKDITRATKFCIKNSYYPRSTSISSNYIFGIRDCEILYGWYYVSKFDKIWNNLQHTIGIVLIETPFDTYEVKVYPMHIPDEGILRLYFNSYIEAMSALGQTLRELNI